MKQVVEQLLARALDTFCQDSPIDIKVENTKHSQYGDYSTNLPLLLARATRKDPCQLAELIVDKLPPHRSVKRVEIAGSGFINFFMYKLNSIAKLLKNEHYEVVRSLDNDINYAFSRTSSVLRQLQEWGIDWDEEEGLNHLDALNEPPELGLISLIARCEGCNETYSLQELASGLHSYFNEVQLLSENKALRSARLCLLKAGREALVKGLQLIDVSTPESM